VINNPTRDLSFGASLAGAEKVGGELNGGTGLSVTNVPTIVVSPVGKISGVLVISFLLVYFL
jgi:hypothetical protein